MAIGEISTRMAVSSASSPSSQGALASSGQQDANQFINWIQNQSQTVQNNAARFFTYVSSHTATENQQLLNYFKVLEQQASQGANQLSQPAFGGPSATNVANTPAPTEVQAHHPDSHLIGDQSSPLSSWTPETLQAATLAATKKFANIDAAKAAGYSPPPWSGYEEKSGDPDGETLHMHNDRLKSDGTTLDPNAPEVLLYHRDGNGQFTLTGVMYVSETGKPTPHVGDLGFFHSHAGRGESHATPQGEQNGMMHVWFSQDINKAYLMSGISRNELA